MGQVLVAHAQADAALAERVADALAAAGLTVDRQGGAPNLKADKARFDAAETVVLVWSRSAATEAALRREAAVAAGRGRLVIAQADGVRPPPSLRPSRTFPVARAVARHGPRTLAAALTAPTQPSGTRPMMTQADARTPTTWKGILLLAVLLAGLAWSAAWVVIGGPPGPTLMTVIAPLLGR